MGNSHRLPKHQPPRVCASTRLRTACPNQSVTAREVSCDQSDFPDAPDCINPVPAAIQRRLGAVMFDDYIWQKIGDALSLSPRERQIILHLFDDEKETVIAARLGISPHTVHMHIERLYRKLGVGGRMNMALRVVETYLRLCTDPREHFPPLCHNRANGRCPLCS